MQEKCFVMIKPGFLKYESQIVERLSKLGKITKRFQMKLTDVILNKHYEEHIGKPFFAELVNYMKSGEVIGFQVEGEEGLVKKIRECVGATKNPNPGTIRYDFGIGDVTKNVIHASDSPENGIKECKRMFDYAEENFQSL